MLNLVRNYTKKHSAEKWHNRSRAFNYYYYDDDGTLVFKGRLRPEDEAVLIKAMQAVMDRRDASKNVPAGTFLEIEQQSQALGLDISLKTAITTWQGEVMDVGTGVEALLRLDSHLPGST